ncbi:MAG: carbamoyl-phosphate synthase large subunit [FCB group bacterium]|nr:carbamoyl-phosphate synthase large subunit [FCB group bacterium]
MPKRSDLQAVLVLGAGPIVIGQACEFDYSGTQALRALREEGCRTILVNSNPATIMTDPELADRTYLEPLTVEVLDAILAKEKPDAILPTVGGQNALNLALELERTGVLEKHGVPLIGAPLEAIRKGEDREAFKTAMEAAGIPTARGGLVRDIPRAEVLLETVPFPLILRPSFTLGGSGGSVVYNREDFRPAVERALRESPVHQVLIEESLLGWKEFELEVIRDRADNAIVVCSIENVDPMGVHTGDSITVAPAMTLTDREYQKMRDWSLTCLRVVGVDTGGSNVQFAVNPQTGRMIIIEMNPRVSRSSALASKATGYPIARVATKLALGYTLDELPNEITGETRAAFEPTLDYVAVKVPRFDFEKFPSASGILGVQMQSVGEVMALGRTFPEALQKAFRSLEVGLDGLEPKPPAEGDPEASRARSLDLSRLQFPTAFRLLKLVQAFREGLPVDEACQRTGIDPWFLDQIARLATLPAATLKPAEIRFRKQLGFSDRQLARKLNLKEAEFRRWRLENGIVPTYKTVDTCAAEFKSQTPYYYSGYEEENEALPLSGQKIIIVGGGPNRIGQGIEFDYCCVQAVFGLKEMGLKTILVNCNPETVSTDFDLVDRLYFEPVTLEDVLNIVDLEKPDGVLIQFGGQTPLKIARDLEAAGVPIRGTAPDQIDRAEDRQRFGEVVRKLGIRVPEFGSGATLEEVVTEAERIGYPVLVRPSYVLGGRAMEIVYSSDQLVDYIARSADVTAGHPILVDQFLEDAFEFDVDALCDGKDVYIAGILQHIEEAGIHSGDSACVLPPYRITPEALTTIQQHTRALARELDVRGLLNIQFAFQSGRVYVLEANPRASRTIPFISKARGIPLARIAAQLALGKSLADFTFREAGETSLVAVKEAVLPFNKFPKEKIFLGPEMKSTGEVMGMAPTLGSAFSKALMGAGVTLPRAGRVFLSVNDQDKLNIVPIARDFLELGFSLTATAGTAAALRQNGLPAETVFKVGEGRPHVADRIKNGEIQLIVNTPLGSRSRSDEGAIGQAAIRYGVPVFTTLSAAQATIRALRAPRQPAVNALQDYFH